ncbi:MAG: hypothetical protein H7268_00355, partial [Sandarakinorhabdus sp.]|nr:hypothetical protein [Sandarakinorhabdus sp.]
MHRDGTVFPIELAIAEATIGEARIFIGYVRDLTAQRSSEAELLQSREALHQSEKLKMTVSRKTTRLITATGTSILTLSEASMLFAASPALADECQLEDNSSNASASSGDKSLACG